MARGIVVTSICLLLFGCTTKKVYEGLYEGVRVRNQMETTPPERAGKPELPSYQQYEQLRKEQVK